MMYARDIVYNWLFDFYKKQFEYLDLPTRKVIDMTCNAEIVQMSQDRTMGEFVDRILNNAL